MSQKGPSKPTGKALSKSEAAFSMVEQRQTPFMAFDCILHLPWLGYSREQSLSVSHTPPCDSTAFGKRINMATVDKVKSSKTRIAFCKLMALDIFQTAGGLTIKYSA